MKNPALPVLALSVVLAIALGFREGESHPLPVVPGAKDSLLLVENNIHRVRSISETEVYRRNEWDMIYINLDDSIFPPLPVPAIERVVTWTEYDRKGRILYAIDSSTASDDYHNLRITTHEYSYSGNSQVGISEREWYVDSANAIYGLWIEGTTWTPEYTLHRKEKHESGIWNVEIDSTVYNADGQKRLTYTYNTFRDSFVEEFTYDSKARLKYRRLEMKYGWSPPWELESTTYTYHKDGSRFEIDSAWRIFPDIAKAARRAGNQDAPDYKWKVLMAAPGTGRMDRVDRTNERRYDARGNLVFKEDVADEYKWVYDKEGKLILSTEFKGEGFTDSIWYEYKNGILYHEKVRRLFNTYHTDYDDTFQVDGVHMDPNRTTRVKYSGDIKNGVEQISTYKHGYLDTRKVMNEQGLMLELRTWSFYRDETVTRYEYFTW